MDLELVVGLALQHGDFPCEIPLDQDRAVLTTDVVTYRVSRVRLVESGDYSLRSSSAASALGATVR
jgi:hypothetical protein